MKVHPEALFFELFFCTFFRVLFSVRFFLGAFFGCFFRVLCFWLFSGNFFPKKKPKDQKRSTPSKHSSDKKTGTRVHPGDTTLFYGDQMEIRKSALLDFCFGRNEPHDRYHERIVDA